MKYLSFVAFLIIFILASPEVLADGNIINNLQKEIKDVSRTWFDPIESFSKWLLITLATISYSWAAGQMVLRNADLQEFVVELVKMIMFVGFFWWLIEGAEGLTTALMKGFVWISGTATGTNFDMNVGSILERGLTLASTIISKGSTFSSIIYAILALPVVILYALICAQVFFVFAEMYVITAAGTVLLGFGGSQWTNDYAKRYITYCVSIGMKLYVTYLIIGVGEQLVHQWAASNEIASFSSVLGVISILLILYTLIKMIPDAVQGIINGTSIGSATPSIQGIAGGVAGAAAGAVTGGVASGMALKAASSLAGGQLGNDAGIAKHGAQTAMNIGKAAFGSAAQSMTGNKHKSGVFNNLNAALQKANSEKMDGSIGGGDYQSPAGKS